MSITQLSNECEAIDEQAIIPEPEKAYDNDKFFLAYLTINAEQYDLYE